MKRVLSLLALGVLAGCATYPDYGYYDNGRSYDGYASGDYHEDRYRDGGDYYYDRRPDFYDDGFYGYGPYSHGYGYGGLGGYGGSLGYGFGHRSRIGLGFGFSSGGFYPYGGYYGGYPYGYSGFNGYFAPRRQYYYDRYDHRSNNHRYRSRGDGIIDNDASDLASEIARQRGVIDSTGNSRADAPNTHGWRGQSQDRQGYAVPRFESAPRQQQRYVAPRYDSAPQRVSQPSAAPRFESRSESPPAPRLSRERDATHEP